MFEEVGRYLLEEDVGAYTDEEEILSVKWKDGVLQVTRMNHEENGIIASRSQCQPIPTIRLADYFVVVGYRNDGPKVGYGRGVILQRFPTKDWEDVPFISEIELFCQPLGWTLSSKLQDPKFFVSVLTDMNGNRHFCSCLSFHEAVAITPTKPIDEEEDIYGCTDSMSMAVYHGGEMKPVSGNGTLSTHHTIMYAPKCLVLMSRLYQIETFRHCLGTVYTVHSENLGMQLETLVGNMLGHVQVPLSGGQQIRFSIGGGDRQALQPPLNGSIPVTGTTVAGLFSQLGINNVLTLFCSVMTEQKILFHSSSITRLTDACHALTALMFPFRYSHVYVPLLPSSITEVACSPTPFIIGVHSSARSECSDLMDVIVADLDGGSIMVPDGISIPTLPDLLKTQVEEQLSLVLHPDLTSADFAFPPLALKSSNVATLDKEIRAVFMRMFAQLFQGYRSCLVIIRIHPKAVITFHKSKFLGQRGLMDCEFVIRLLDCMFFNQFICERGSPWRACDIWDDLYNEIPEKLKSEHHDPITMIQHVSEVAQILLVNENPGGSSQQYMPKIMKPPDGAHTRIHMKQFPTLNPFIVQEVINDGISKQALTRYNTMSKHNQPRIVPFGSKLCEPLDSRHQQIVDNSARRLEVLRTCISYIFDNRISDARKTFHAVTRALTSKNAKLVLCQELGSHITGAKAVLNAQQFDMVVKLMHCALQDCSVMDEHGIAAALLPLACEFYRKLCSNVKQFAYTCIQEHPVWKNQQFWESVFFIEVEKEIKKLYIPSNNNHTNNNYSSPISFQHRGSVDLDAPLPALSNNKPVEYSSLEIAAEQMRLSLNLDTDKLKNVMTIEESTVVAQAVHFLSRMTYMLVPLDTPTRRPRETNHYGTDDERASNITSMAESDSVGGESGFEDQDPCLESGTSVKKFIARFIDKVCTEGGVGEEYIRRVHGMISTCVDMHIEDCENVYKETKRLPPVQKPRIPNPAFLPGEVVVLDSIRVYLLPDGREDATGGSVGGPVLLPAEGALFFTNYRLVFKGTPCDPYASEQTVVRSFPIASLTKEKRVTVKYLAHLDQLLQEGLQLRSATFQLMKLAFDEEVSSDTIHQFRKTLNKLRHPQDISGYFAFAVQQLIPAPPSVTMKDKNTTLKGLTKKAISYTAKKAGLKPKANKRQKYILRSWAQGSNGGTLPATLGSGSKASNSLGANSPLKHSPPSRENLDGDDASLSDDEFPHNGGPHNGGMSSATLNPASDSKSVEKLMVRSYYKDWKRMGLGTLHKTVSNHSASTILSRTESFRISFVNSGYSVCRSYPALLVVPNLISEESVKKVARCYRGGRFPVITWKHPRTRALLVRGSSFNSKGLMAFLKGHPHHAGGGVSDTTTHVEHENFLKAIVSATPMGVMKPGTSWMSESNLSLDSVSLYSHDSPFASTITPKIGRKGNKFQRAMNTLRYAGSSGGKGINYWTTGRPKKPASTMSTSLGLTLPEDGHGHGHLHSPGVASMGGSEIVPAPRKAAVYVFGEKGQVKGIKTDHYSKIEYVPVDFFEVRQTRTSFKKLMRASLPSTDDPENSFLKDVEATEWLSQLSTVMMLTAGVVDFIDEGSSVILCLEDGSDVTSQICSLAQICLDPYYRTIEGFITLVEKEWLAFGHRFSNRNNVTGSKGPSSNSGFAPIFLQFLDIVHQLHHQFPLSFEFNQYFLKFLAYHSVSGRFRTFLADNELERVEYGFMAADDKRGSLPRPYKGVDHGSDDETMLRMTVGSTSSNSHLYGFGQSVFEYMERHHAKSPVFFNFKYDKDKCSQVLRPMRHTSALQIWDYYTTENLSVGASFDFEVLYADSHREEDQPGEVDKDGRKCVMSGYDVPEHLIPSSFRVQLAAHYQLEHDKGILPQKWKQVWDKLEPPSPDSETLVREPSPTTLQARALGRSLHKYVIMKPASN